MGETEKKSGKSGKSTKFEMRRLSKRKMRRMIKREKRRMLKRGGGEWKRGGGEGNEKGHTPKREIKLKKPYYNQEEEKERDEKEL